MYHKPLIMAIIGLLVLAFWAGPALAQEEEGVFENGYYYGTYDEEYDDDWFFDTYETDGLYEDDIYGYYGEDEEGIFGDQTYYEGGYEAGEANDDWFFDYYDDPGDEGFWDF